MFKKIIAVSLALAMVLPTAALAEEQVTDPATEAVEPTAGQADEGDDAKGTPLVVAYSPFSAKFSPY